MASRGFSLLPRTIAWRLTAWFLLIALVPCGALTAVLSGISSRSLESTARQNLRVIQASRSAELEDFARDRLRLTTALAHAPVFVQAAQALGQAAARAGADSEEFRAEAAAASEAMEFRTETLGFPGLLLFAPTGETLLRLGGAVDPGASIVSGPLADSPLAALFENCRTLLMSDLSRFGRYEGSPQLLAFVGTPILDRDNALVGVLALQLDNREVFRTLSNSTGLGQTGEVIVGGLDEGEGGSGAITIVSPLRHARRQDADSATVILPSGQEATVSKRVELGSDVARPLQEAVMARRGYGETIDYRGEPVLASWGYLPSYQWGLVVKQDVDEAFALIGQQRTAMALMLSLTVVGVVLAALLVARSIARPIRVAAEVAQRIADGDLTGRVELEADGETGQLLGSFRTMTEYLRRLIGQIKSSSVQLTGTATAITAASRQQERTVQDYGASTNEAAAAVKQISATSQELLGTMNNVNQVASETARMAGEGREALIDMERSMRTLAESTGSISSRLSVISERANAINLVVTTITKVADQTNLLSINAAIEAEKAGEYGRGFLVVAREIRRLADQTAVATLDIDRMVKEMHQSVSSGVMEMDKFHEQVRQGVEEVNHLAERLGQIIDAVGDLTPRFEQVTEGMRAQALGADQIREAMVHLSEGASRSAASIREFNDATERLREAVSSLRQDISFFRIEEDGEPAADRRQDNGIGGPPLVISGESVVPPDRGRMPCSS
ncbi:methyl-accepting chemotaxis protein [Tautonia sociabilis]|uniref:Methyl-accepting chemotaxis protein n=1 Tax=Tautonia sociabilis TaxID=2080755 RepID=A0A432MJS1_9BACT|nr:methyl-accepting chemotaxis protein [Tautonia sociabilis]RUL87500.1 methyl-accepting chemotaxis protein [Tautonia sociabilis]